VKYFKLIATGLGTGYSSFAPGTIGSALGITLFYLINFIFAGLELQFWNILVLNLTIILITLFVGVYSIKQIHKIWDHDSSFIVIDEIVGISIGVLMIPFHWKYYLIAFVLFRFFDIVKPLFIKRIDRQKGNWSVMLDDVVAGVYTNIVIQIIVFFNVL
jgi:phosphatidylglycerophosphatase A